MKGIDLFRLDGRVAIVTGASKGLGLEMSHGLASAGATVVLCSRDAGEIESAAAAIREEHGTPARGVACDVTEEAQVDELVRGVLDEFGRVDILINNAGINIRGPIEELAPDDLDAVLRTNVRGPWLLCRAVAKPMKKAGYGRVINMSSALGAVGVPNRTPYASSKGAVTLMTKVLALEWAEHGITVNAICPGPFLTPMNEPIAETEDARRFIVGAVALERWGEMHEIQGAAIFLASDASSFVTGSELFVDGGWTAR